MVCRSRSYDDGRVTVVAGGGTHGQDIFEKGVHAMSTFSEFQKQIRNTTKRQVIEMTLKLLSNVSEETFFKLTYLMERLVEGDTRENIRTVRAHLRQGEDDPATRLFKRVMSELSPHCLQRMAKTLFINSLVMSADVRDAFEREHGFRPPFTLLISPTMRCNLHCAGCYSGKYQQKPGLSYETIDRILSECEQLGTLFIVFSGGEPMMRKDELFELIGKYRELYFMFYTNGTLIDRDAAHRIGDLGNAGAVISLEGFKEATDRRRGDGTFDRIMDAFGHLKEFGVPFGTSITVTRNNVEEVTSEAFYDMIIERGVMVLWYFLFMPVGKDPDTSLMPTPEQREYLRQRDIYLRDRKTIFIADFWNDAPHVGGCIAAGRNYMHINANGDVEPCVFAHHAVDNIDGKSLTEVLNSDFFKYIRSKQPYSENLLTPCQLIDHPEIWRDAVRKYHAYPTHLGAEDMLNKISGELDDYSRRYRTLAADIWDRDYVNT